MPDVHSPEKRSFNMSQIRGKNTKPEMALRSMIHRMGYRFRLHRKDLPGTPDIVFPGKRKIIFVQGCFFHMHDCKYGNVVPKTNYDFWQKKRLNNVERDRKNITALEKAEWQVLEVWECEIKKNNNLKEYIAHFLHEGKENLPPIQPLVKPIRK